MKGSEGPPVAVAEKKSPRVDPGHHEQQSHRAPRILEKAPTGSQVLAGEGLIASQTFLEGAEGSPQANVKFGRKEAPKPLNGEVKGQLQNDNTPRERVVRPLKSVEIADARGDIKNHDEGIQRLFDNLAATRDIETGTQRTEFLQSIVDKMLAGKGIETKVYILGRGLDSNAFAVADGSIFISQSLIDNLDTVDELVGVIGHEVGHLKHKTFENVFVSHDPDSTGWVHESASDSLAPRMLEKTGYNSTGFGEAIKKVSSRGRDFGHQSGLMRATQSTGQHMAEDYATSSVEPTPLPNFIKGENARKTNYEIVREAIKKENFGIVRESLPLLAPPDLRRAFDELRRNTSFGNYIDSKTREYIIPEEYFKTLEAFQDFFAEKLRGAGFSKSDINTYLFLNNGEHSSFYNFSFLETPDDVVDIFKNFSLYKDNVRDGKIRSMLFGEDPNSNSRYLHDSLYLMDVFRILRDHSYNPQKGENKHGIPLSEDTFIEILKTVDDKESVLLNQEILQYMEREFSMKKPNRRKKITSTKEDETWNYSLDIPNAKIFLRRIHDVGIIVDKKIVQPWLGPDNEILRLKGNRRLYREQVKELIWKEFGFTDDGQKPELDVVGLTDKFIADLKDAGVLPPPGDFLSSVKHYFDREKIPDSQRAEFLNQLLEKIDTVDFEKFGSREGLTPEVRRYILKEFFVMGVFGRDSTEFYDVLEKTMNTSGINFGSMDWFSKINLASNLLQADKERFSLSAGYSDSYKEFQVTNYARFSRLPHFQKVVEGAPNLEFGTIAELNEFTRKLRLANVVEKTPRRKLYEDDLVSVVTGSPIRKSFEQFVARGVGESEFGALADFMTHNFPDSPQTNNLLREIDRRYLHSTAPLSDKSDYLEKNFDRVGPDGMAIVAEQIYSLEDYAYFSGRMGQRLEDYLGGSEAVKKMARADYVTSQLSGGHWQLFKTLKADAVSVSEASSEVADNWFRLWMEAERRGWKVKYDKDLGKFEVDASGRQLFKSISDTFDNLHNLSQFERFVIALKALVDQYGALTDEKGKRAFAENITEALGIKDDFVSEAIRNGILKGQPDLISIPAAQMAAPLLFRALDVDKVHVGKLSAVSYGVGYGDMKHKVSSSMARRITHMSTRDLVIFGKGKVDEPTAPIAKLVFESDRSFGFVNQELEKQLRDTSVVEESKPEVVKIDQATEAVIRGVEASGALGVRSLQLARQLYRFSPEVDARLAQTFDANQGMNKLIFWHNLQKVAQNEGNGAAAFINGNLVSIDQFLGGGSLYTTFAAKVGVDGETRDVVVKMLNPNPEHFIGSSYKTAIDTLDAVSDGYSVRNADLARLGRVFVDLSQEWCLADINDATFETDDDDFRVIVEKFNQQRGVNTFHVPKRFLTTPKVKSEERAEGQTLNKVLADKSIGAPVKAGLVRDIEDIFAFQLNNPARADADGTETYVVHSDPHIGNYVIDLAGEQPKIGVIDRSMYLKLSTRQAQIFRDLIETGDYRAFMDPFMEEILDHNKIRDAGTRVLKQDKIMSALKREYIGQKGRAILTRGQVDNLAVLRKFMSELEAADLAVPLEMRLMIRNVEAFRQLKQRYS
ncbi:M48 family metalloprotease [Candidatus Curtissbacteria bacterium]|nr:M48 family metalloprotease [Candidatus Curtissbacteria bacterium]